MMTWTDKLSAYMHMSDVTKAVHRKNLHIADDGVKESLQPFIRGGIRKIAGENLKGG
jgi:hypothetical protein